MPLKTNEVCFGGPFHPPATSASYDIETRHVSKLWGGTGANDSQPIVSPGHGTACMVEMTALSTCRIYRWGTYVYYFYLHICRHIHLYVLSTQNHEHSVQR